VRWHDGRDLPELGLWKLLQCARLVVCSGKAFSRAVLITTSSGSTTAYCGAGCQSAFGQCTAGGTSGTQAPTAHAGGTNGYRCPSGNCCSQYGWW
jgi:hypothetical protein